MLDPSELQRRHLLTMIETAQRVGRSENEIVALVERELGTGRVKVRGKGRLVRQLLRRAA